MAYMGQLKSRQQLRVVLQAHLHNQGGTSFGCFFEPQPGKSAPKPKVTLVMPGQTEELFTGSVDEGAQRFRIDVDLPIGGSGTLQVIGGGVTLTKDINADTAWVFWVEN